MDPVQHIRQKLEAYLKRFYLERLVKGLFWALSTGITYIMLVALVEHVGWLGSTVRMVLFVSLVMVLVALAAVFVAKPLLQVFKFRRDLTTMAAARSLESEDPLLADKLQSLLELMENPGEEGSLHTAGLRQKAVELSSVPIASFARPQKAFRFSALLLIPGSILGALLVAGMWDDMNHAALRLARYDESFEKPLPYRVFLSEQELDVESGQRAGFVAQVEGSMMPDGLFLVIDGNRIPLAEEGQRYPYTFPQGSISTPFTLETAEGSWGPFELVVRSKARLELASIEVVPPAYTGAPSYRVSGIQALEMPEGSIVRWNLTTRWADSVTYQKGGQRLSFATKGDVHQLMVRAMTSGSGMLEVKNQETTPLILPFTYAVVLDESPLFENLVTEGDSLYGYGISGTARDDYLVKSIHWHASNDKGDTLASGTVYAGGSPSRNFRLELSPQTLMAWPGREVYLQFKATDNDGLRGGKASHSQKIPLRKMDKAARAEAAHQLAGAAGDRMREMNKEGQEIDKTLGEMKKDLLQGKERYKNEQRLQELLNKEKNLLEQMQRFSKEEELREQLSEEPQDQLKEEEQDTRDRLSETEAEIERLLEEIQKLQQEEPTMEDIQRLEQNQQRLNKQLERNEKMLENLRNQRNFLEQAKAWDDLAQKQDELKDGKEDIQEAAEKQAEINEQAEQLESKQEKVSKKQMSEDERKELSEEMQRMEESLEEAQEQLQGGQKSKAKDSQKKSSDSMRKMASQMRQAMAQQSSSKQKEDAETIRQLLKGLMYLSFEQEDMSIASRQTAQFDPAVEELNRRQARMNEVSRMVSDTLGALAARNPKVGNYILDESMHMSQYLASSGASLRERNLRGASSSQMLAMTHANNLALMLQESLEQMQQSMAQNMPGSQSCEKPGGGQQGLSDVIKKQKGLGEKMQQQQGGTQPGQTGYSAEQLAGILAEQEKLRQEINALKQKAGDRQAKLLLQEIQDLMEEQEEDISMRRLDQRVMNRQKEILTRMLESDRAIREREQDEQRESGNLDVQMREGALRTKEEDVQTEDVLQVQPIRFKPHFQRVADQYSGGS